MKEIKKETKINKKLKGFIEILDQKGYYIYINVNSIKSYRKKYEDRVLIKTDNEETYCLTEEEFYKVLSKMNTIEKLEGF